MAWTMLVRGVAKEVIATAQVVKESWGRVVGPWSFCHFSSKPACETWVKIRAQCMYYIYIYICVYTYMYEQLGLCGLAVCSTWASFMQVHSLDVSSPVGASLPFFIAVMFCAPLFASYMPL